MTGLQCQTASSLVRDNTVHVGSSVSVVVHQRTLICMKV